MSSSTAPARTAQRVTIQAIEGEGFIYRASCNVCHWVARRVRPILGEAQLDARGHAKRCAGSSEEVKAA